MPGTITDAENLFIEGRIDEARDAFLDIHRRDPKSKEALNNLGVIAYNDNQRGRAAAYFSQALEIDPLYLEALLNLCDVFDALGEPSRCLSLLEMASIEYPDNEELAQALKTARWNGEGAVPVPVKPVVKERSRRTWRVLQGSYEIANQSHTIARALEANGHFARTLCYFPNYLKYKSDYVLDINACPNETEALLRSRKFAEQLIPQFDVFHFHFGTTLTLDYSDLPVLASQDKKMVTHYWGSEVRLLSRARKINPYIKVKNADEEKIRSRMAAMAAHVKHCIVGDYELYEYVHDIFEHVHVIPALIDTDAYRPDPERQPNDRFLIVHAPTDNDVKGSKFVQMAIDDLQVKYDFEYRLIQGMSHEEAKRNYAQADLIVDELHCGSYGLLSIETMAMGKPVITWISDYMREKYPAELPIISANPDTVRDKIEYALNNRDGLPELGRRGREYVKTHHDMNVVIRQIEELYDQL